MSTVSFLDLVKLSQTEISRAKIRFHQKDPKDPLDMYLSSPDIINHDWLFWRPANKRVFTVGICDLAINFIQFSRDTWLLTTIKEITSVFPNKDVGVERPDFAHLYGRLIIKYEKKGKSIDRLAANNNFIHDLEVEQLLPQIYDGEGFPGYDNVRLSFIKLENIVNRKKVDWVAALGNQKAVYLITDTQNGKMYVGSATGDNGMLLQRWTDYVSNGHGGNEELKDVVTNNGLNYIRGCFQYSILENYNSRVDKSFILGREEWWKKTLRSREFGYNKK